MPSSTAQKQLSVCQGAVWGCHTSWDTQNLMEVSPLEPWTHLESDPVRFSLHCRAFLLLHPFAPLDSNLLHPKAKKQSPRGAGVHCGMLPSPLPAARPRCMGTASVSATSKGSTAASTPPQLRGLPWIRRSAQPQNPSVNICSARGRRRCLPGAQGRVNALTARLAPAKPPGAGSQELPAAQKRRPLRHCIIPPLFPGLPRFPRTKSRIVWVSGGQHNDPIHGRPSRAAPRKCPLSPRRC